MFRRYSETSEQTYPIPCKNLEDLFVCDKSFYNNQLLKPESGQNIPHLQGKKKHHRISVLGVEQKKKVKKNYVTIFFIPTKLLRVTDADHKR